MLDALNKRFDNLEAKVNRANGGHLGVKAIYTPCEYCGDCHTNGQCLISQQIEPVNYAGNFHGNNQNNPYSNTYNQGWRNHPNFSWSQGQAINQASSSGFRQTNPPGFENQVKPHTFQQESFEKRMDKLESKLESLIMHVVQGQRESDAHPDPSIKNLEVQMGQLATVVNALQQRDLPSNTVPNPRKDGKAECKAITLKSGDELLEIQQSSKKLSDSNGKENTEQKAKEVDAEKADKESKKESAKKKATDESSKWMPPLPFPQRFQKKAIDEQYKKFLEMFKQLHINIPFIEALEQMPKYAKFLKEMLSKKKHFTEFATVALTREITSVIKPNVPFKCKDPGSFTIPCLIGDKFEGRALCDLGSAVNIMPLSIFKKLQLGEVDPTTITLQLADRSLSYPYGIIKDVLVKVGSFIYPADFIVLDIEEDKEIPLIVGRPFLATARALVDVEKGEVILRLGDEQITFSMDKVRKHLNEVKQCAKVAVKQKLTRAKFDYVLEEPPEAIVVEKNNMKKGCYVQTGQILNTSTLISKGHWHCLSKPP